MSIQRWKSGLLGLAVLVMGLFAPPVHAQEQPLTHDEVERAINNIVQYFYQAQDEETGAWFGEYHADATIQHHHNWGPTALALLALITANESPEQEQIARGLTLLQRSEITGVYAMSARLQVWSYLADSAREYERLMRSDSDTLNRSWYGYSRFNYVVAGGGDNFNGRHRDRLNRRINGGRIDNSVTQFGVYGLWHGARHGARLPGEFWQQVVENFLELQNENGGWSYNGSANTNQSMTLAALTCLYIVQQEVYRGRRIADPALQEAIDRGLAYLEENLDLNEQVPSGQNYLWYSYERFAQLSGRRHFANTDIFVETAGRISRNNANYGRGIHRAAFDLMVLSLGNRPIWINKLEIQGAGWNNRPNDVFYINDFINNQSDYEQNWQIVNFDMPATTWNNTPLLWLSSDQPIEFTFQQAERIKAYLDNGGTLIINPESGDRGGRFAQSIRDLVEDIYPGRSFEELPTDHPIVRATGGDLVFPNGTGVDVLTNNGRVAIIMPREDWGFQFQMDRTPSADNRAHWRIVLNLYTLSQEAGQIIPRLPLDIGDDDDDDGGLF